MNKFYITIIICVLITTVFAQKPIDRVNIFIGTDGPHKTEYGGTTPAVSTPFGMTQWCAVTRLNDVSQTMYRYCDTLLLGFMASHQPLIWEGDYGFFTMMPQVGTLKIAPEERGVRLDRTKETATPYYYSVSYDCGDDATIFTEFTATSRSSFFRIKYPVGKGKPLLFIEAGREKQGGGVRIYPEKQEVHLFNKEQQHSHLGPKLNNFQGCYVLKFSKPFKSFGTWKDATISDRLLLETGSNTGCYIEFDTGTNLVEIRTGSSFISYEQAEKNLNIEIPAELSFEKTCKKVKKEWEKQLNKIKVKGASDDEQTVFYTSFFRTLQYPREFSEYGRYYSAFDDQVHDGVSYNDISVWDIFRAEHPWLMLTVPDRVNDIITALIQMYKEGGWLPKWPNPTYTNLMIGTHADIFIANSYVQGLRNYDVAEAYNAIRKDAFTPPTRDEEFRWQDRALWNGSYEARAGLTNYMKAGYVAADRTAEAVSRTLEFALDDYCIAQMAKALCKDDDYNILIKRAENYKHLYNPETGFFQARKKDGSWASTEEGFTEGGKWTYRFCVMQDVPGMITLMGTNEQFIKALDENFDKGHYRHDNEPGHHFVYLYNHCNRLDLTQARIPGIIEANYRNRVDGYSGNEDCGQMSAWYLFSVLGFYPLTPASGEYALGIPRFEAIRLRLPDNKTLTIKAKDIRKHKTLTTVKFNGVTLERPFIPIKDVLKGGVLEFLP